MTRRSDATGRRRLTEGVVSALLTRIVSGTYRAGDMLPSEPELGNEFAVSRTVIREAVKILEDKGVVSVVQGRGSTVRPRDEWNSLDPGIITIQLEDDASGEVYQELMLVRIALESEMAAEAAERLTPSLENGLRSAIEGSMAHRSEPDLLIEHDVRFHQLITDASGNRIGRGIMVSLEGPMRASFRLSHSVPVETDGAHAYHEPIFDAIAAGDPERARRTMREHLTATWKELRESGLLHVGAAAHSPNSPAQAGKR